MSSMIEFHHPSLGVVRGLSSSSTTQFLGLQYATIAAKWDPPILAEGAADIPLDGTKIGPTAPSPPNAIQMEFAHIQKGLPVPSLEQSETECLNLNITTPAGTTPESKLPVIVFLHGGGFAIGCNAWPQYDFKRIVALSIAENRPVIGVNVNYRLGVLGFLTSRELESHGYQANNGLHDQRTALLWIRKNIAGFGGDADQITLVGESAGGVSATHHLQSDLPLFKRLVSMGGTNLLMQPLPHEVTEATYKTIVDRLGLGALSPSDRVKALVQIDTQTLLLGVRPSDALSPSVGGVVDVKPHTYAEIYQGIAGALDLPGRKWCQEIIVGDCQLDASILSGMINHSTERIAASFRESLSRSLGSAAKAGLVLSAYSISEDISDGQALKAILRFASDICFFVPVLNYGHCWSGQAFIYQFNEANTWDGPWKGYANHILDVAYLFQNYNEYLPESQRGVAIQFAKDVIAFANGNPPWAAFKWETGALNSRVYGGRDANTSGKVVTVPGPEPRTERANTILVVMASIPADDLARAWGAFMAGF
ncbi:Alpha/Beta hydrolase protein [Aspergillus pseudoustus]|uniref:Carboxylic ester hydrolase n=1 Tax=Aspergillus pseudoustus TaxID=1810923 RepID=A0ABR4JI26_9EURO